ncbi:unnamed protein product, partial [Hapterophycus canaliculatus]
SPYPLPRLGVCEKVSLIMTAPDLWLCVNVGVDGVDIMAKEMSIVWLVVDFFSNYHRSDAYGCPFYGDIGTLDPADPAVQDLGLDSKAATAVPSVSEEDTLTPPPPRSIDVRVWVTRPHIAALEFPQSPNTSALLIEGEQGVYYRWQSLIIAQVIHMEAAVQGVAAIVVNAYHGASESRGARGTAGSGSGTRTLVDGLSLSMAHNHWLAVNHLDLHASLPLQILDPDDRDGGGEGGIGGEAEGTSGPPAEECKGGLTRGFEAPPLNAAKLQLRVPQPCAVPVQEQPSMDLGPRAGDIVASVEDLVFAASSVMVFLGPQALPMPTTAPPSPAPEPEEPLEPSSGIDASGVAEVGIATSAPVAGEPNTAPSPNVGGARRAGEHFRGEKYSGLSSSLSASPIPVLGSVGSRHGLTLTELLEARQEGGRHGQHGGGVADNRGESWGFTTADSLQMSPTSPDRRSPFPGGPSVLGEIGPRRSLRNFNRPAFRSRTFSSLGGAGQATTKRGSLQSPSGDPAIPEMTEGEESSDDVIFPAAGDLGNAVGAAGGGGQGQQHPRVLSLLKSEMSALPSLAGFGMGGSDNSDSDGESTGESGISGRRFFTRKRRSTDASLSFVDRGQPNTEGRLRRMSNVISRRPRTSSLPSTNTEGESVADRDRGHITASSAAKVEALRTVDDEVELATSGAAATAAENSSRGGDAQGAAVAGARLKKEEEDEEEDSLPPFTMALAVMLTGIRVFLVDQVLGLHLPVMKLCLASMSCVIENRLESEDNELEHRLHRVRRRSSPAGRSGGGTVPSVSRPPPAPTPSVSAGTVFPAPPGGRSTGPNHLGKHALSRQDFPLSQTWHGGGTNSAPANSAQDDTTDGGGQVGSTRFAVHGGSRANLLKGSRRWGTGRGSRVLDADGLNSVRENEQVEMTDTGTPTKSVKFALGRKRAENGSLPSSAAAGHTGSSKIGGVASKSARGAAGKPKGREAADPRAAVMNVTVQTRLWAESFNNTLRCWEALLDPFRCDVLAESSTRRGAGLAVKARCPLHLNVTAALLDTLSDMKQQLDRIFAELDTENFRSRVEVLRAAQTAPGGDSDGTGDLSVNQSSVANGSEEAGGKAVGPPRMEDSAISRYRHREVVQYHDVFRTAWPPDKMVPEHQPAVAGSDHGGASEGESEAEALSSVNIPRFLVCHEFCAPLPLESRMSFTILNLTGQRARYFQPRAGEETRRLQYLRDGERGVLLFTATMTVVRNGRVQEVPFDTQTEAFDLRDHRGVTLPTIAARGGGGDQKGRRPGGSHTVAVQVSGYRWLPEVRADSLGTRAIPLHALLGRVDARRVCRDPGLAAALSLVTDVHHLNGGRQVTLRSVFRLQNCTDHTVMVFTHPDRNHKPMHPRTGGRFYRGGGPSPWAAAAAGQGFQVGGNAFFPGVSSYGGQGSGRGAGKSPGAAAGGPASGAGTEDVTLVEPGKVLH